MSEYRFPPWGNTPPLAPPAPLATVLVHGRILGRDATEQVDVLLDSGADYTQIPLGVAKKLGLRKAGEKYVNDQVTPDPTYYARIEMEGRIFEIVAIATDEFTVNGETWGSHW